MIEDLQSLVKLGSIQNILGLIAVVLIAYFGFLTNFMNPFSNKKSAIGGTTIYHDVNGLSGLSSKQKYVQNLVAIIFPLIIFGAMVWAYLYFTKSNEKQKYTVTVCGTITDESGNGIEGATFNLLGFKQVKTDTGGVFSIKVEIYQQDTIFEYQAGAKGYKNDSGKYDTSIKSNDDCSFSKQLQLLTKK